MSESGQLDRLWNAWKASPAAGCLGDGAEPLETSTLLAVFLVLVLAGGLSAAIFMVELLFGCMFPHRKKVTGIIGN